MNDNHKICRHYYISGTVQGVFYRANTQKKALQLKLTGWVKNLNDGRVEAVVCGDEHLLDEFEKWLWQGPQLSKVTKVNAVDIPSQNFTDFEIR